MVRVDGCESDGPWAISTFPRDGSWCTVGDIGGLQGRYDRPVAGGYGVEVSRESATVS